MHGDSTALLLAAKLDLELKLKEEKSGPEEERGKKYHEITQFLIDNGADVTALGNIHNYLNLHNCPFIGPLSLPVSICIVTN